MSKKISVVVPVFNEKNTVLEIIDRIKKVELEKEIIIVDDASTDGSTEILKNVKGDGIRIFYHEKNLGKGAALRTGFKAVSGDIVIIQDADMEYDPQEYHKLIQPILDDKADVVYGSRFVGGEAHRVLFFWHMVGNKGLTFLSNMLTNLNLSDMETCYKVFRSSIIAKIEIEENAFGIEPEITAKVAKLGARVYEVGIAYSGRSYDEGKKIGWKDGVSALRCILKYNLFR